MSKNQVELFLGDPVEDRAELHVLNRLRGDLERRGIRARIHANFLAGPQQLQVDLLVVTEHRVVHAEMKNLDPTLPLLAEPNGPWRQRLPDRTVRVFDRNGCRQARDTTYQLSDAMRKLAADGAVPCATREFFRDLDTVVCVHPAIPVGSDIVPSKHVDVIGYEDLIDRLTAPGPRPAWRWEHWDAFALRLGLYPEPTDSPAQRTRQARQARVADYRREFAALSAAGLHELVPVAGTADGVIVASLVDPVTAAARRQHVVVMVGPSEAGKTHTARHAALTLARTGATPVWVRCREYEASRLSVTLARAVAPYSTAAAMQLLGDAAAAGSPLVVILDGFNECPSELQDELVGQLSAFRRRWPCGVIVTSTKPVPVADAGDVTHVELAHPNAETRGRLLASYGASATLPGADALLTPLELVLAAECAADLPPEATRTDVLDAYVRRRCPSEKVRAALRRIAARMDERVRLALPMTEAMAAVRDNGTVAAESIDQVLSCPLLAAGQGRLAFTHETLGRFLAAEHHVVTNAGVTELADALRQPHRADLREYAVALQPDGERRAELLTGLTDPKTLAEAARGHLGGDTAAAIRDRILWALADVTRLVEQATFEPAANDFGSGDWALPADRTEGDHALVVAAALCLPDNLFMSEVATLLDATDVRCAREMRRLQDNGHRHPITAVVDATYSHVFERGKRALRDVGGSVIARTCAADRMFSLQQRTEAAAATGLLTATAASPRWGRLFTALHLLNPCNDTDLRTLPELVADAWNAKGYHLRLEALYTAERHAHALDDDNTRRMLDVLRSIDTGNNWGLSSALVDALTAFGDIEPVATLTDITNMIAAVLADPGNPDSWDAAERIIGLQFDNEAAFGPYGQAVAELTDEQRLQVCVLAMRRSTAPFHVDWIVGELARQARAGQADEAALAMLRQQVVEVAHEQMLPQEPVSAHVAALRAWATLAAELPAAPVGDGDLRKHAWRLVDRLTFALLRGKPLPDAEATSLWAELLDLCPTQAVQVLRQLRIVLPTWYDRAEARLYELLAGAYPDQLRVLYEWVLTHREATAAGATISNSPSQEVVTELGRVGNRETANLLRRYLTDPELGGHAVDAIRSIEHRLRP